MEDIYQTIEEKLLEIEETEKVRILYAVESGSRAWGVESPDSDYDVRFVYVRTKEEYLRLEEIRDVIEWQLDEVLDINGWDLKKTLVQFQKGNATLFEWSNSPIVYRITEEWKRIYRAAESFFSKKAALYHYYGTANSTYHQYLTGEKVKYKKYFYALRPLLASKYIEENQCIPPVLFSELLKQDLPTELKQEIDIVLNIKSQTDENVLNTKMPMIQKYIQDEISRLGVLAKEMEDDRIQNWELLNKVFVESL